MHRVDRMGRKYDRLEGYRHVHCREDVALTNTEFSL